MWERRAKREKDEKAFLLSSFLFSSYLSPLPSPLPLGRLDAHVNQPCGIIPQEYDISIISRACPSKMHRSTIGKGS